MTPAGLYDVARPGGVVVLAPRWTRALSPAGDAHLPRDGVVVLVAAPGVRRLAARALGRGGWAVRELLLAVPDPRAPGFVATLAADGGAARAALTHQGAGGSRTRRLAALALRLPGGKRALGALAPRTALLLTRAGGPRPFAWLEEDGRLAAVTVTAGRHGGAVVRGWRAGAAGPAVLAKVARADEEAGGLDARRPAASTARPAPSSGSPPPPRPRARRSRASARASSSAAPPRSSRTSSRGRRPAPCWPGSPSDCRQLLDRIGAWLLRWNAATRTEHTLTPDDLERWLHAPARRLGLSGAGGRAGDRVPLVAVHRDLTTDNVLPGGSALGVVDWEHAAPAWLPFTDLAYAAVDAIAVVRRVPRAEALAIARRAADDPGDPLGAAWRRHREAVGRDVEELALRACFLHHAVNELAEPGGGDGQFGAAARALLGGGAA